MAVTTEAITSTNTGRRTSGRTQWRIIDTSTLLTTSVSSVASPRPRALTVVLEMASSGQRPSTCTSAGLLRHRPSTAS